MIHVLIVDEAESFGGSLVVAGLLVDKLDKSFFRTSVAIAFEDTFTDRTFTSATKVFLRKSPFSYKAAMTLRFRVSKIRNTVVRRSCELAISAVDLLASAIHCVSLAFLIVRERVSLVHSNNSVEAVVAGFVTRRPVVCHLHGVADRRPWLMRRCDAVVAISDFVRDAVAERGIDRKLLRVIPNGVDLPSLEKLDKKTARRRLGIPDEAPMVALPGRVVRWKGQSEFLKAAKEVHRRHPDAHFVLVGGVSDGDPEFLVELMEEARHSDLGQRLHCTGYVEDVCTYLVAADVVVHASIEPEPFGLVIIEGMALARPVIASSLGAGAEIVTDEVDGLLVDPRDTGLLALKISTLLDDADLAERIGHEARRTVEERYSANVMSDSFGDLYREFFG